MTTHHALLIGVDHYFEYVLPNRLVYRRLGGCVRDINKVYSFLTTRIGVDPANIIKLTATNGSQVPVEPASVWPTYTNMVNAFKELTDRVQEGDQVYIQYSGHGGRALTMLPKLKGATGFDEGLVPLDIGKPGDPDAKYLRDFEMYNLLQALVDKKARLTVVFDCCHSGGATRDIGGARKRGTGQVDSSQPPTESAVGELPKLIARWQGDGGGTARAAANKSAWLFEPKGYTLFAACRGNESAFEFPFDGRESNGALTYWMLDTLAQADNQTTWKMVADRVSAKVHGQFEQQTPMLQGEVDYLVFGADKLDSQYAVNILKVDEANRRVRLNAGEAHGLATGSQFAIYPNAAAIGDAGKQLATVELTTVEAVESWGTAVDRDGTFDVQSGMQALLLNTSTMRVQRQVLVTIADAALRQQVEEAIAANGRNFIAVATPNNGADFLVDVTKTTPAAFVIQDTAGNPLPFLNPSLPIADAASIAALVERLVHLAQFRNVQQLDMPDPKAASNLKVELIGNQLNKPGDSYTVKVTNTQKPNPRDENDPNRVLNITVLMLSSDWSITQIYPEGAAFEDVNPGKSVSIELDAYLPEGVSEGLDIFKVFATRSTTSFHWLELPSLDQPIKRSGMRGPSNDPLEQLLFAATGEQGQTRLARLTSGSGQGKGWTVDQVEVVVTADGKEPERLRMPVADGKMVREAEQSEADAEPDDRTRMQLDPQAIGVRNGDEFQIFAEFSEAELAAGLDADGAVGRGLGDTAAQLQERSKNAIETAMKTIKEMALQTDLMRKGIPGGSQPRMVKIKFGINMNAHVGAFLARAGANATMEVELEWARRSDDVLRVLRAETDVEGALFTDADENQNTAENQGE